MTYDKYDEVINGANKNTGYANLPYRSSEPPKATTLPMSAGKTPQYTQLGGNIGNTAPIYKPSMSVAPAGNANAGSLNTPVEPSKRSFSSDDMKVREMMRAAGFDDSKIGYDGANVLYDNQYFLTPDKNVDGTTYTNAGSFSKAMNDFYDRSGIDSNFVDVSKHVAGTTGLYDAMTYDESGKAFLAGREIPNQVIMNGQTYASQSDIDKVFADFKKDSGYGTYSELIKKALAGTSDKSKVFESMADEYAEKEFEYDPANDNVYQAVSDEYQKLAKTAYDDIYAQQAARTGGYANSAALSSAGLAYQKMLDSLAVQLPEYADRAENRYESLYDKILDGTDRYGTSYDRDMLEYNAGGLDRETIQQALTQDRERDESERKWHLDDENSKYDRAINEREWNNITLPAQKIANLSSAVGFLESLSAKNPTLATTLFSDKNKLSQILYDVFGISYTPEEINSLLYKKNSSSVKKPSETPVRKPSETPVLETPVLETPTPIFLDHNDIFGTVEKKGYPYNPNYRIEGAADYLDYWKTKESPISAAADSSSEDKKASPKSNTGKKDADDVIEANWD